MMSSSVMEKWDRKESASAVNTSESTLPSPTESSLSTVTASSSAFGDMNSEGYSRFNYSAWGELNGSRRFGDIHGMNEDEDSIPHLMCPVSDDDDDGAEYHQDEWRGSALYPHYRSEDEQSSESSTLVARTRVNDDPADFPRPYRRIVSKVSSLSQSSSDEEHTVSDAADEPTPCIMMMDIDETGELVRDRPAALLPLHRLRPGVDPCDVTTPKAQEASSLFTSDIVLPPSSPLYAPKPLHAALPPNPNPNDNTHQAQDKKRITSTRQAHATNKLSTNRRGSCSSFSSASTVSHGSAPIGPNFRSILRNGPPHFDEQTSNSENLRKGALYDRTYKSSETTPPLPTHLQTINMNPPNNRRKTNRRASLDKDRSTIFKTTRNEQTSNLRKPLPIEPKSSIQELQWSSSIGAGVPVQRTASTQSGTRLHASRKKTENHKNHRRSVSFPAQLINHDKTKAIRLSRSSSLRTINSHEPIRQNQKSEEKEWRDPAFHPVIDMQLVRRGSSHVRDGTVSPLTAEFLDHSRSLSLLLAAGDTDSTRTAGSSVSKSRGSSQAGSFPSSFPLTSAIHRRTLSRDGAILGDLIGQSDSFDKEIRKNFPTQYSDGNTSKISGHTSRHVRSKSIPAMHLSPINNDAENHGNSAKTSKMTSMKPPTRILRPNWKGNVNSADYSSNQRLKNEEKRNELMFSDPLLVVEEVEDESMASPLSAHQHRNKDCPEGGINYLLRSQMEKRTPRRNEDSREEKLVKELHSRLVMPPLKQMQDKWGSTPSTPVGDGTTESTLMMSFSSESFPHEGGKIQQTESKKGTVFDRVEGSREISVSSIPPQSNLSSSQGCRCVIS